jgi:hypothetical protein
MEVQWKTLNVITLRWMETYNINQKITITSCFYIVMYCKNILKQLAANSINLYHINRYRR